MLTHTVGFCSSPRDMARIGLLLLGGGSWNGERIVSEAWLEELSASCTTNPAYGCADPLLTPSLMPWSRTVPLSLWPGNVPLSHPGFRHTRTTC